jgi:hypothetical protein
VTSKPFEIQNEELYGPVCYITENEGQQKKVRFEIKEGINKSNGVEIVFREEVGQYVFAINFDKHKLFFKGADPLIREKWHLIQSFLKSRIQLVDPDRLKSVTVILPLNTRSGIRTKKVKLLITLFLLLVSENYILLQKSNGYSAIEKDGKFLDIFNIKATLSKHFRRARPSKRSIYHLQKFQSYGYDFAALSELKPFQEVFKSTPSNRLNNRPVPEPITPVSPLFRRMQSNPSVAENTPLMRSRSPKKRQTRIDMQQLIKMFQIEDEPQVSEEELIHPKKGSIQEIDQGVPKLDSPREEVSGLIKPFTVIPAENPTNQNASQEAEEQVSGYQLSPIKEADKSNVSSSNLNGQSPVTDNQSVSRASRRFISPDHSTHVGRHGHTRRHTRLKVALIDKTNNLMFDNALDVITKTGFSIQKLGIENPRFNSVTLCKVVTRFFLSILRFENCYLFVDFRINFDSIPQSILAPIDPDIFKKVGLTLHIWTNSLQFLGKPLEIPLSESGFDFFARFGHGEQAERAIKKIVTDNRAYASDKLAIRLLLLRLLSSLLSPAFDGDCLLMDGRVRLASISRPKAKIRVLDHAHIGKNILQDPDRQKSIASISLLEKIHRDFLQKKQGPLDDSFYSTKMRTTSLSEDHKYPYRSSIQTPSFVDPEKMSQELKRRLASSSRTTNYQDLNIIERYAEKSVIWGSIDQGHHKVGVKLEVVTFNMRRYVIFKVNE